MIAPTRLGYADALRALQDRGRFGIRLGLGRTRALLRAMGDPQRSLRGALIAGTNGKGSVLALAASALQADGYRVGQTPKPHLITYRERLQVDSEPVDPATFARVVGEVLPLADRVARRLGDPTEFELLTAVVFRWFAEQSLDVALVEVGLGGRLDATHAWDGGVAVVTNVSLDHMDRLGSTIKAIAHEKAAIIERGDRAVTGADGEALAIVRRRSRRLAVPLRIVTPAPLLSWDRDSVTVDLGSMGATRVGLRGRHQAANVAVADALLDELAAAGIADVGVEARRTGFATVRWPGRLELLATDGPAGRREVLLDGAHNPAGAAVLATALDDLRPWLAGGTARDAPPLTLLMAAMADKDVAGIVARLETADALMGATIICTQVKAIRALPAEELGRIWASTIRGRGALYGGSATAPRAAASASLRAAAVVSDLPGERRSAAAVARAASDASSAAASRTAGDPGLQSVVAEADIDRALELALRGPGPVVVAGSLYLVGAVRARLVADELVPDPT